MNTPLLLAVASLMLLIATPATRDLLKTLRERSQRQRLVPIRIETQRVRRARDPRDEYDR
jgi:Tfp pilus assembly protein FimT